ncbi:MAG: ABC transporter substrate binding protein [Nitrosomonadales bacterium]
MICSSDTSFAGPPEQVKNSAVVIVLSEDGGPYAEFSDALHIILSHDGISHEVIELSKPIPDSQLVIGVGMKAARAVAAGKAPFVLNVFIPKSGYEKLLHEYPNRADPNTFSAIFLDQPDYRQANLIKAILPDKRNIGLLYSSPPEELAQFRKELTERGLNLHEQEVDSSHPLAEALQDILRGSDVLLALPDAAIYNSSTIRNILLGTYRNGVPLIGFSSGYVKAGALGAVFSTPAQIATQTAALIVQFNDSQILPIAQYPHEFEVMVNEQVAHSLGLVIKDVSVLHSEISAERKEEP